MPALLMPKATAVWLVDNTILTFDQIAKLCGMHSLEIQAISDGEVSSGIIGLDPIANGQLTREEISRCEADPNTELKLIKPDIPVSTGKPKGARYTPISKRNDKPDAIAWLLKHQEELNDSQIGRLVGTTRPTINAVRDHTHWNASNLRPRHPVELGLCTRVEIDAEITKAREKKARQAKKKSKTQARPAVIDPAVETPTQVMPISGALEPIQDEPIQDAPLREEPMPEDTPPPPNAPIDTGSEAAVGAEPSPGSAQDTGSEETPAVPPLEDSPQDESSRDDSTDPSGTL